MACCNKCWIWYILVTLVPVLQLLGQACWCCYGCKIEFWEIVYHIRILLAQVLEHHPTPPSCHGHEHGIDSFELMSIAVQAPCKKVFLEESDSPLRLDTHLLLCRWELASLEVFVSFMRPSRLIVYPTPHCITDEVGEGLDIHNINHL